MTDLIAAVREYALANYEKDGWDYLVECWSDEDIAKEIGKSRTVLGAISKCRRVVKLLDERRQEVRAEIW
jgi:hypothetical protein